MWYMHQGMGWWMVFGGLGTLIIWGGIIALIVWGIRRLTGCCGSTTKHSALDVAKERYARGDISREQFEQLKKDLS